MTANNNEGGVVAVYSHANPYRVLNYTIIHSVFVNNNDVIIRNWGDIYTWPSSYLAMYGNVFIDNEALIEISTFITGMIDTSIMSYMLCFYRERSMLMTSSCEQNNDSLTIASIRIADWQNITYFGCDNMLQECYTRNFKLSQYSNINAIEIEVNNHHPERIPLIYWRKQYYVRNQSIWTMLDYGRFSHIFTQFIFDGVYVDVYKMTFIGPADNSTGLYEDNGIIQINNGVVMVTESSFQTLNRPIIRADASFVYIEDATFIGNEDAQEMISTHNSVLALYTSLFDGNNNFKTIIKVNSTLNPCEYYQYINCRWIIWNSTFQNGYSNDADVHSIGTGVIIARSTFINGSSYVNSLNISSDSTVDIKNSSWNSYTADDILKLRSDNSFKATVIDSQLSQIIGRGILFNGNCSNISLINSVFDNIQCVNDGSAIFVKHSEYVTITEVIFDKCTSEQCGGAAFIESTNSLIIESSVFSNGIAQFGASIYYSTVRDAFIEISRSEFYQNIAMIGSVIQISSDQSISSDSQSIIVSQTNLIHNIYFQITLETKTFISVSQIIIKMSPLVLTELKWLYKYDWNENDIKISFANDMIHTPAVPYYSYQTPLILTLQPSQNTSWNISNETEVYLYFNFSNFMAALSGVTSTQLDIMIIIDQRRTNDTAVPSKLFLSITNSTIGDNIATVASAINIKASQQQTINLDISRSRLSNNLGLSSSTLTIIDNHLNNQSQNHNVNLNLVEFISNVADTDSASLSIFAPQINVTCHQCVFSDNSAGGIASGIYMKSGFLVLNKIKFTNNTSSLGANIMLNNSILHVYSSHFDMNQAIDFGGSVIHYTYVQCDKYLRNNGNIIIINNSSFNHNKGVNHGAIYISFDDNHCDVKYPLKKSIRRLANNESDISMSNNISKPCDGIQITINPDFHANDISWSVVFNDHFKNITSTDMNACIYNIPNSIKYAEFTIFDEFGDGLNYGEGNYQITWKSKEWNSASFGNFGNKEVIQLDVTETNVLETLVVLGKLGDTQSLRFVELIDQQILPAMDGVLRMLLFFKIKRGENITDCNCKFGFCLCDTEDNITIDALISVLCYSWTSSMQQKYNYSFTDFWYAHGIIFNESIIENECRNMQVDGWYKEESILLYNMDHANRQSFGVGGMNPLWISSFLLEDEISDVVDHDERSYCEIYSILFDLIDPICNAIYYQNHTNLIPSRLCQSSQCHSSYCNSYQAHLVINNNQVSHMHLAGTNLFNIPSVTSHIFGYREHFQLDICFNQTIFKSVNVYNTIPILILYIKECDYNLVVEAMEVFGARAVIITVDNIDNMNESIMNIPDVHIPVELIDISALESIVSLQSETETDNITTGMLCVTNNPTFSPTGSPTPNPTSFPSQTPTHIPTFDPTKHPTPFPMYAENGTEEFIIFFDHGGLEEKFQHAVTLPQRTYGQFMNIYQEICDLQIDETNDKYNYYITLDTLFEPFDIICVQLNDNSNTMITEWNVFDRGNEIYLQSETTDNTVSSGCNYHKRGSKQQIPNVDRGTYCFVIYTIGTTYNIIIKSLIAWPQSSTMQIINSNITNNTNLNGNGGGISMLISNKNVNIGISTIINGSLFEGNVAGLGGAISGQFVQSQLSQNYNQFTLNIIEMNDVKYINNTAMGSDGNTLLLESVSEDMFIFANAILLNNVTIDNVETNYNATNLSYGSTIILKGMNAKIGNSRISNGRAINGGCIWLHDTAFTLLDSVIVNCSAQNNGGGLFQKLHSTHLNSLDVCLAIYHSTFINNYATNEGAALFIELNGENANNMREQDCVKFFDVKFSENIAEASNNSVYIWLNGDHSILHGNGPLNNICNENNCLVGSNILRYICCSTQITECEQYVILDDLSIHEYAPNNINISKKTGWLFIFGWTAFDQILNTKHYSVDIYSDNAKTFDEQKYGQYLKIRYELDPNKTNATFSIVDTKTVADTLQITLMLISEAESEAVHSITHYKYEFLAFGGLFAICIISCIIGCILYYSRRNYLDAFVIRKTLVLIIGISQFDDPNDFLPGVKQNVDALIELWRKQYKYEVVVCNANTLRCTKQDIINFIDQNIVALENQTYKAVIVHIISHGLS
eukprot:360503_1